MHKNTDHLAGFVFHRTHLWEPLLEEECESTKTRWRQINYDLILIVLAWLRERWVDLTFLSRQHWWREGELEKHLGICGKHRSDYFILVFNKEVKISRSRQLIAYRGWGEDEWSIHNDSGSGCFVLRFETQKEQVGPKKTERGTFEIQILTSQGNIQIEFLGDVDVGDRNI